MKVCGRDGWRMLAGATLFVSPVPAVAQDAAEPATEEKRDDIVVTGRRPPGSALGDAAPVAVLDADAIRAMGVTSIDALLKLLKPLTTSNSGREPVFLLNGRRIAGYQDLQTLPPEAMERTEILNEQDSARFGFPSTVRVVNFVTKKHFRAVTLEQGAGVTTEGGGGTVTANLGATRIEGPRRTTLSMRYERQNPLYANERPYAADNDTLFDVTGNLRGLNGGSIDPALDRLAGRAVTTAAAPADPAQRGTLSAYVAGAGAPRVTDISPFLSLASRDQMKVDATHTVPVGQSMTGSLTLSMDARRGYGLAGLQGAALRLPANSPASPFADDALLYRYLGEGGTLAQRNDNLTLHAGSALQGGFGRWMWTVTGGYDRVRARTSVDRGVDPAALQAAVDAGADPYALGPTIATADRVIVRSRTLTNTATAKATANGPLINLPAGQALLTLNADYAYSDSNGRLADRSTPAPALSRAVRGGSASVELPLVARGRGTFGAIGDVSANGTLGVTAVSDFGNLTSSNVSLRWAPRPVVELTASINTDQTPPPIATLTNPVLTVPNTPFFDFVTGVSALIPVTGGGNTGLAPEERQIRTLGLVLKPFSERELRLNLNYVDTRITDQIGNPVSATPALQAAFPDRFPRGSDGQLLLADLRPLNLYRERERKITAGWAFFGQLGPKPAPPAPPAKGAPPPPPPKRRPMLWTFNTVTARLDDRLVLRPGQPELNLLEGESLDGNSGRPRYEVQFNLGGSYGPMRLGTYAFWRSPSRIRSTIAASDLRFTPATIIGLYSQLEAGDLAPKAAWAKGMTFQFEVENLLNDRTDVRDRTGAVPFRFQPSLLDPFGRKVSISVRKLF